MVLVPVLRAVIIPVLVPIAAYPGELLLQVPPLVLFVNVVVLPTQTDVLPLLAAGAVLTVTTAVREQPEVV
jgi:hypothetical protein